MAKCTNLHDPTYEAKLQKLVTRTYGARKGQNRMGEDKGHFFGNGGSITE